MPVFISVAIQRKPERVREWSIFSAVAQLLLIHLAASFASIAFSRRLARSYCESPG